VFNPAYFSRQYFPPVWFAPGDESAIPEHELKPPQGGQAAGSQGVRHVRFTPRKPIRIKYREPDDAESLLLIGAL
jgi:hypothetical protein